LNSELSVAAYARAIEAHLCRKNDGHLIRIVGPAFETVTGWATQGIPIKVTLAGVDRYFERYYRKGPRRRPVRIEFCEADVLDAFDEWRRAVGVSGVATDPEDGTDVEEPLPVPSRPRRGLRAHLESLLARLTVLRGSDRLGPLADHALATAVTSLEPLLAAADHARGEARQRILDSLLTIDRRLLEDIDRHLPEAIRTEDLEEAARELEPFRARMSAEAYQQAKQAAVTRLRRERYGLPEIGV
jgi:hypothetical protein